MQHAVRQNSFETFQEYTDLIDSQNRHLCTLRGLFQFKTADPVPLDDSGTGKRNREAVRDRRDVVRVDLERGARDASRSP